MGEVNINDALEGIRSERVKERTDGLADLKHILSQNRSSSKIDVLSDKAYHQILEALFRVTKIESSTYNRASKANAKKIAEGRLSACAGVLKLAVEVAVKKLRFKTVKALIDHIIQTLPTSDEGYCEPLVADYFKSLRIVLEYQPHTEHLPKDEWNSVVDFCNQSLHDLNFVSSQQNSKLSIRNSNPGSFSESFSRSATPVPTNDHGHKASKHGSRRTVHTQLRSSAEDILLCLRHLTIASNAPVLDRAHVTLTNLLELLESNLSVGRLQPAAFEIINSILTHITTNDISLTLQTLRRLLVIIRRFWDAKSTTLKDCMLVSLLYGQVYFSRMISSDETSDCKSDLESLLEVFQNDYCKRLERDQLQLEDLDFADQGTCTEKISSIKTFRLRLGALRAENPWNLLYITASIAVALSADVAAVGESIEKSLDVEKSDYPTKRRKLIKPLDDILKFTQSSQASQKLFSLQVLTFVFDVLIFDIENFQGYLDAFLSCMADDNGSIASWAMLALTSAAHQSAARSSHSKGFWLQTWRVAARHTTSSMTCRTACLLMAFLLNCELVHYSDVVDIVDNMITSVDLNGPADCVDSACTFWSLIVLSRGRENLGLVSETSEHILRWLCTRWRPTKSIDGKHTMHTSQHQSPHTIFLLICTCLGFDHPSPSFHPSLNLGQLSQARLRCLNEEKLIQYLLLNEDHSKRGAELKFSAISTSSVINLSKPQFQFLSDIIVDFLLAESSAILRDVFANRSESIPNVGTSLVFMASSLSIIGYALLSHINIRDTRKGKDLRGAIDKLKEEVTNLVARQDIGNQLLDGILESFLPFLGPLEEIYQSKTFKANGMIAMAHGFNSDFWERLRMAETQLRIDEDDAMELDNEFESQGSRRRTETAEPEISHNEIDATTDSTAFQNSLIAKICFLSGLKKPSGDEDLGDPLHTKGFMHYLVSLKPHEFLACRTFMRELFGAKIPVSKENASLLFEYLVREILPPYEFERCEVSMGFCLEIMTGLAETWTNNDTDDISELGGSLYEWFIRVALNRGISSPHVHSGISSMLQRVIKVRPEYARTISDSLPSARTSLFRVLQEGNIRVKFHVGQNISEIFGLFVLTEHDNILEDVISNLPSEILWQEGIALRLFVLAHLAASWPTLLRRCVYAIFETPGHAYESAGHAKHCLTLVSKSLGLGNLRGLFKLFVSQIIYTWLETQPLRSIPYSIFGYAHLPELLQDVQDEVIGQIVMRGKDDEALQLAADLERSYEQLLECSFSKAAAYSILRDVAVPPSMNKQAPGAEARLRKTLGKELHTSLVNKHFPEILACFYKTLDEVEDIQKGFQKHLEYSEAYKSYQKIMSISASETVLPVNQQPSFRARYLIDEIQFLCRRTGCDPQSIWSPELYVYVLRELLNTIHPALGSLHACYVLRRIRLLICMAGQAALEFYPLEMALHSLRPYITNTHCSEDTIGIVQYLLEYGTVYIKEIPSFLAGLAVSTLTSMKVFLKSTQESTTQESQFRATMSTAHNFHAWFANYLDGYASPYLTGASEQSFRALVKAARNIRSTGNPNHGTYESDLLLEIFEDQRSGRCILNQPAQDLILGLLCREFELPSSFRDDILGSAEQATLYAPVIWKTCRRNRLGQNYLLWVGKVLGRAYASTGVIDREMTLEIQLESDEEKGPTSNLTQSQGSRSSILRLLCDIVLVDNPTEVGMAETVLRSIITKVDGSELFSECEQHISNSLMKGLVWRQYQCPTGTLSVSSCRILKEIVVFDNSKPALQWIQELCVALARIAVDDPVLSELVQILIRMEKFAEEVFPYVLHLVLQKEVDSHQATRSTISEACSQWFRNCEPNSIIHVKMLLRAILYLRKQPLPHEATKADRSQWLQLDFKLAAEAATKCAMFKTALLFLDIHYSEEAKASRRSSKIKFEEPTDLLLNIFQNIDEQDAFYGVQQPSSLSSMMSRLEYENAGFKSLSFRGAHYDSHIRLTKGASLEDEENIVKILDTLDLNGLSQSLLSKMTNTGSQSIDSMLRTARKLEQWDLSAPASHISSTGTIFRAFQSINNAANLDNIVSALSLGFKESMELLITGVTADSSLQTTLGTLSILTEADEIFTSRNAQDLQEGWSRLVSRETWMSSASFKNVASIVSCRETIFSSLSKNKTLQTCLKTSQPDARTFESYALLSSSKMSRRHGALQNALATATYLTHLIEPCKEIGLNITAAAQFESANVLWDQGEMAASIRMLQDLQHNFDAKSQLVHVGMSELLARLGHQISEARLEKPDEIINQYLAPAIKELRGVVEGDEAGQVFHEFASFCDQQLQNADGLEDFHRMKRLRERKISEVQDLDRMIKSAGSQTKEKDNLRSHRAKAKQWFDLDDREYQRLLDNRQEFLRQSLENYLQCLKACDKYDNDVLRFSALWLENWENKIANAAVSKFIAQVGSRKFAPLMNQWTSRLLDTADSFQNVLSSLVLRICTDHPFHGMYQIFAGSKTRGGKDEKALSRNAAATNIVNQLKSDRKAASTWLAIHNTNISFVKFATEKLEDPKVKPGAKVALRKSITGGRLEQDVHSQKIPPPTMKISLRADCDYKDVPTIAKFQSEFTVASGISMPKIVTAIGTDGLKYKQLFKGGNDDLRQDAIMEQVFEQVSNLLQTQQATRQRNLGIRTYKVLPLTATSGIIEFVPNTIPLHDYLMPAHQRHFPKDLKPTACRKHIADAQTKPVDQRIKIFRQVTEHFHPVLRYFFTERFENPDEWFDRRLAYTRSTAAISILGHVLGLGDRHGHNILLDEKTGEVVHIDLGIAFEQGRVLPVPEVVPFRLTRDLVDGMGITRTEGVFRRCCEFTLDALRQEAYSIMTILDVLRYDPLYSWSLSPLRLRKVQDAQNEPAGEAAGVGGGGGGGGAAGEEPGRKDEPGEADRALTVVAKKLSKSLSVTATVNELIQQATDERNLAVLFAGWASYA